MPKRYKLLKDHPYAKEGTIMEEMYIAEKQKFLFFTTPEGEKALSFAIPLSVEKEWLEPIKEETTEDFSDAIKLAKKYGLDEGYGVDLMRIIMARVKTYHEEVKE